MLTAKRIERLREPGRYRDGEVKGLYLQVVSATNRSWILRYQLAGREPPTENVPVSPRRVAGGEGLAPNPTFGGHTRPATAIPVRPEPTGSILPCR
jgi:hypothetical protein